MAPLFRRLLVTVTVAAAIATGCGSSAETTSTAPAADVAAWPHDFTAPLVGGGSIDVGDYAGQDLVLWFWAPW